MKNHKIIAWNSTTTKAGEKISTYFEFFGVCLTKLNNNKLLLNKISHRFLLFNGWKSLIGLKFGHTDKKYTLQKQSKKCLYKIFIWDYKTLNKTYLG